MDLWSLAYTARGSPSLLYLPRALRRVGVLAPSAICRGRRQAYPEVWQDQERRSRLSSVCGSKSLAWIQGRRNGGTGGGVTRALAARRRRRLNLHRWRRPLRQRLDYAAADVLQNFVRHAACCVRLPCAVPGVAAPSQEVPPALQGNGQATSASCQRAALAFARALLSRAAGPVCNSPIAADFSKCGLLARAVLYSSRFGRNFGAELKRCRLVSIAGSSAEASTATTGGRNGPPTEPEASAEPWCIIAYWELNERVGPLYRVQRPWLHVTFDERPSVSAGEEQQALSLHELAAKSACRDAVVLRTRAHIGQGVTLAAGARRRVGLQPLREGPVRRLAHAGRALGPQPDSIQASCDGPSYPPYFARISFVKGWGPKYARQVVTSLPCSLELIFRAPPPR
ncbi:hypothetical protein HPB48_004740 [Haemaphysalis longicornis]|uniref:MH2 domain-containing protein n=1 Tax=Haemaphysalis longicornis TaxID=44386 RepID=A0A9J6G1Q7_HAELO|nr:hypothetical protein HPB48_004740 [Haemaphysalis longicornis]